MEVLSINNKEYLVRSQREFPKDDYVIFVCECEGKMYKIFFATGILKKQQKKNFKNILALLKWIDRSALRTPRILEVDKKNFFIVREYLFGESPLSLLGNGDLSEEIIAQLLEQFHFAKTMGINLDYRPQSFILFDGKLYYIGDVYDQYKEDENLINKGLMLWFYSAAGRKNLQDCGISVDRTRIKPENVINKDVVLLVYKHYHI